MNCCIQNAIRANSKRFQVKRQLPGTYEDGYWQPGPERLLKMAGSVQPMRPEEILRMEDSRHIMEALKIYTTDPLRIMSIENRTQSDVVVYGGFDFEVESIADWGSYKKIVVVRKEQNGAG